MRAILASWFSPILCWFFGHRIDEWSEEDNCGNIISYYQLCVRCGKIILHKEY